MLASAAALAAAILLPGFSPLAATPGGGQVLTGTFPGTARPGLVYLPPSFDLRAHYPVVYLLHGMPGSPTEYTDGTELGAFADDAIAGGRIRPFIGVMPAAGTNGRYNGEWAGAWERAIVQLVPWIDAHLPTDASRDGRVLAGLSAGGFGAVDIALRHPDLFATVESWSGYFTPLHDGPFKDASPQVLAAHDPVQLVRDDRDAFARFPMAFYLSTGPLHSHWAKPAQTLAFGGELRSLGVPHALRVFPDRKGEWREQLDDGLLWALAT
jgi:enterochelin esterase-like enzyme